MSDERLEFINGLRELADFFEANPGIPTPFSGVVVNYWATSREEVANCAKLVKGWTKGYTGELFMLQRTFSGGVRFDVNVNREHVCRQVVIGKTTVPAEPERLIPASPEHEEDVTKWECDEPLLA